MHRCFCNHGEWYATITARYAAQDAEPIIVIAGPFVDVEEAKAHNRKWLEASSRLGQYYFIGMASVPAKVRQRISTAEEIRHVENVAARNSTPRFGALLFR